MKNRHLLPLLALLLGAAAQAMSPDDLRAKSAEIDRLILAKLEKENLQPNAPASDEVFVRRIHLDIAGRIPTLKETTNFLADSDPAKREKLIDRLLASDGYQQHFFNFWSDLLRLKSQSVGGGQSLPAGYAYADWLRESLKTNKPYDQMVRELVSADGKTYENGAVGFYIRDYNMPLDNMAVTTQIFLGTSMVCAQCHNHPFDKWSQMDYYQMAAHTYGMTGSNGLSNPLLADAFYGRSGKKNKEMMAGAGKKDMGKAMTEILRPLRYNTVLDQTDKRTLRLPHDYQYSDAKPKDAIEPVIPASFSKDGKITREDMKPVEAYAQWMASKDNPRFTLVIANRLWKKAMGMGLIEPVDEITDSTVPSNPQLMAFLEQTMKEVNYDMKAYLRVVFNSASYQRAAHTQDVQLGEQYHFPGPLLRRMSAEQIWDSIVTLHKPGADVPSADARVERTVAIRRIEWLDRALNALSSQELAAGAAKIAALQKQLAAEVRAAQEKLVKAQENNDEKAIREARRVVSTQRSRINEAAQDIVYTMGFKKFAELAREGKLKEQVDDVDFAREITALIKSRQDEGLTIDDALNIVARQQKARLNEQQKARLQRDAETFNAATKQDKSQLLSWERMRDTVMVRAADLRSPAPNGHFLRTFGQSDRELVDNGSQEASVTQALALLNGGTFNDLLNPYTVISRALERAKTPDAAADTIFLSLFSRKATDEEKGLLAPVIEGDAEKGRGDALWVALNTRQFYFIE
ncbi:MAG TPA: hypothetical protein DIT64_19145 [Verrucomicrobiales bacterium]|nr:hypothetical protein [Verrucomicrobiales bacterium]